MNRQNKTILFFSLLFAIGFCFLSGVWYSKEKTQSVLRENPAQLMPFKFKNIQDCIDILKLESLDESIRKQCFNGKNGDLCSVMASGPQTDLARLDPMITVDSQIYKILGNRRSIKIISELQGMPTGMGRVKAISCFERLIEHFDKVIFREFFSDSMGRPERDSLGFGLFCIAESGTASDLVNAFVRLEHSQDVLLKLLHESGRLKNVGPHFIPEIFPDYRLRMNAILTSLVKTGRHRKHLNVFVGLQKKVLPVPKWDAPLTTLEAGLRPFKEGDERPSYINPDGDWREYVIYDFPREFYFDLGQTKKLESVQAALEALRASIDR